MNSRLKKIHNLRWGSYYLHPQYYHNQLTELCLKTHVVLHLLIYQNCKTLCQVVKPYYWHKSNATREINMMASWMPEYMLDGNKLNVEAFFERLVTEG